MMLKLSVVVAIFNVSDYLKDCVDSVLKSTYKEVEIILVDDGSTDMSSQICDSYKESFENVVVIHKKNGGLASARKAGAIAATGDYITFIDGDDWVKEDYFEKVVRDIDKSDVDMYISALICYENDSFTYVYNEMSTGIYDRESIEKVLMPGLLFDKRFKTRIIPGIVLKTIRTDVFRRQMTQIDDFICDNEDTLFSMASLKEANSVQINNEVAGYVYRIIHSSMSTKYKACYWDNIEKYCDNLKRILENNNLSITYKDLCIDAVYMIIRYLENEFFSKNGNKICERTEIIRNALQKDKYLGNAIREVRLKDFELDRRRRAYIYLLKCSMMEVLYIVMAFPRWLSRMKSYILN